MLECEVWDYDIHGESTGWPEQIVMRRVAEFVDVLRESSVWGNRNEFLFFTGVPVEGELSYELAEEPAFALEHGIAQEVHRANRRQCDGSILALAARAPPALNLRNSATSRQ